MFVLQAAAEGGGAQHFGLLKNDLQAHRTEAADIDHSCRSVCCLAPSAPDSIYLLVVADFTPVLFRLLY